MPFREEHRNEYPSWIGLVFVFNLIVGTGALTLPAAFSRAGWLLGIIFIVILAFISYITVTFVIETMACANAVCHWRRLQYLKRDKIVNDESSELIDHSADLSDSSIEHTPLFSQTATRYYSLDTRIELSEMAGLFFNDIGRVLFYLCIAIYLYGDLSIYSAAVAKSLRDVICIRNASSWNMTDDMLEHELCWDDHTMTRVDCYRLSLIVFVIMLGPFSFFGVQKTKYIQMITVLLRWMAFTVMISIAVHRLIINGPQGHPPMGNYMGIPALFGACIYSFMCHHSLPSLVAPISNKYGLKHLLSIDYVVIATFYLCLAITGTFAFANLEDLYTLNFVPNASQTSSLLRAIEYFLSLFPVFTLSASFPIISITLRNNLQTMFLDTTRLDAYNFLVRRVCFPLLAIVPPITITYFTDSLTKLVEFTGYAGMGIQYFIPVCLVYRARCTCTDLLGQGITNDFRSPFSHFCWLVFVILWATICVILVTVNSFTLLHSGDDNNGSITVEPLTFDDWQQQFSEAF